ncbi:MAG TPA: hypothetical protein VK718_09260 [Ferruginibacter sp.]|jgi:hypothetical protein|nr:hypothetical protein [Ferruginibacter sp.]
MSTQEKEKEKKEVKTIKVGGRTIPLKGDNTPNLVHCTKDEREWIKKIVAETRTSQKALKAKEWEDSLKNLLN